MPDLVGQVVMIRRSKRRGTIINISDSIVSVKFFEGIMDFPYPEAFSKTLKLKDEKLQQELERIGSIHDFEGFKRRYIQAVQNELRYLRETGGKQYQAFDGKLISSKKATFVYYFQTDADLCFQDGTSVRVRIGEERLYGAIVSCEDFTITIELSEDFGKTIRSIEFSAEPWFLLEALVERIGELDRTSEIAFQLACMGKTENDRFTSILYGQDCAVRTAQSQPITFIWGPPGTGKTATLSRIASEYMLNNKRILMVSYSNVSVDEALLRVAECSDKPEGCILRYGYPRDERLTRSSSLISDKALTTYDYVLKRHPSLFEEIQVLQTKKRKCRRDDSERTELNQRIRAIKNILKNEERAAIQKAMFVATTVSKAVVDSAVYGQQFDLVIFDEASMAYVPQVVFSASLAKESFCCLGDFKQLPAIVSNPTDMTLSKDIFHYVGIANAVENGLGHKWLVMLSHQFRMHPEISDFAGSFMYRGMLSTAPQICEHRQLIADCAPLEGAAMSMVDLSKTYSVCEKTYDGSRVNLMSAMISILLAESFADKYSVGIITPYSAQARLVQAMLRDIRERDPRFQHMSCATVHQFQGSEKPVIIYDAVDCFLLTYPGVLLTSMQDDLANRLFNVALTRAQGKFILVTNSDYMHRKRLSKKLMFAKAIQQIIDAKQYIFGEQLYERLGTEENDYPELFMGDRDEVDSWNRFLQDIGSSKQEILMEIPGKIDYDLDAYEALTQALTKALSNGVNTHIRTRCVGGLPNTIQRFATESQFISTPLTIIDRSIVWYGEPLYSVSFISEGELLQTEFFPCFRFHGINTVRLVQNYLRIE